MQLHWIRGRSGTWSDPAWVTPADVQTQNSESWSNGADALFDTYYPAAGGAVGYSSTVTSTEYTNSVTLANAPVTLRVDATLTVASDMIVSAGTCLVDAGGTLAFVGPIDPSQGLYSGLQTTGGLFELNGGEIDGGLLAGNQVALSSGTLNAIHLATTQTISGSIDLRGGLTGFGVFSYPTIVMNTSGAHLRITGSQTLANEVIEFGHVSNAKPTEADCSIDIDGGSTLMLVNSTLDILGNAGGAQINGGVLDNLGNVNVLGQIFANAPIVNDGVFTVAQSGEFVELPYLALNFGGSGASILLAGFTNHGTLVVRGSMAFSGNSVNSGTIWFVPGGTLDLEDSFAISENRDTPLTGPGSLTAAALGRLAGSGGLLSIGGENILDLQGSTLSIGTGAIASLSLSGYLLNGALNDVGHSVQYHDGVLQNVTVPGGLTLANSGDSVALYGDFTAADIAVAGAGAAVNIKSGSFVRSNVELAGSNSALAGAISASDLPTATFIPGYTIWVPANTGTHVLGGGAAETNLLGRTEVFAGSTIGFSAYFCCVDGVLDIHAGGVAVIETSEVFSLDGHCLIDGGTLYVDAKDDGGYQGGLGEGYTLSGRRGTTTLSNHGTLVVNSFFGHQSIQFADPTGVLSITDTSDFGGTLSGLMAGDVINLPSLTNASVGVSGSTLVVTSGTQTFDWAIDTASLRPVVSSRSLSGGGSQIYVQSVACFVAGTRIRTLDGDRSIEDLRPGDLLPCVVGAVARPVRWVGRRTVRALDHAPLAAAWPIRIRAHAFGPDTPARDLFVSPEHAIYLDGVLIPARLLVDGRKVRPDPREMIDYVHVELDSHDVILAEGLPAETWRDTGNRAMFANAPNIPPPLRHAAACAPIVTDLRQAGAHARRVADAA